MHTSLGLFVLRLVIGIIFIKHGLPKIKNPEGLAGAIHWPRQAVLVQGLVEFLGGIAMIVGIQVQVVAVLLGIIMLGAIYYKKFKWNRGFTGDNGWEFDLILLASNIAIFLIGGGFWVLF
jgi:putative oxidoreductase